jgi:hypothetical protein
MLNLKLSQSILFRLFINNLIALSFEFLDNSDQFICLGLSFYVGGWQALFTTVMLAILEVSLSFDNAIINAKELEKTKVLEKNEKKYSISKDWIDNSIKTLNQIKLILLS